MQPHIDVLGNFPASPIIIGRSAASIGLLENSAILDRHWPQPAEQR
jgi:hypothetical protein